MDALKIILFKWCKPGYRSSFPAERINVAARMLCRHTTVPFDLICVTDDPTGLDPCIEPYPIWENPCPDYGGGNDPNCLVRLPMFGAELSKVFGPRWLWSDADMLVTRNIDHILSDPADFKIWRPDGGRSLCNGSLVLCRAGARQYIWDRFRPDEVGSVAEFRAKTEHLGSDQAWISTQLTESDQFFGQADGVYAFRSLRNPKRERHLAQLPKRPTREPRDTLSNKLRNAVAARRARVRCRLDVREAERVDTKLPPNAALVYFPGQVHPWDVKLQETYPWIKEHYR